MRSTISSTMSLGRESKSIGNWVRRLHVGESGTNRSGANHGGTEITEDKKPVGSSEFPDAIDDLTYDVIGAGIEVHRELGPGYLESVYEDALDVEFQRRDISAESQFEFSLDYKGRDVGGGRIDFFVDDRLVVELKAVDSFAPIHTAQVISYLKATDCRFGLLMNFNVPVLRDGLKRVVWD